MWLEWNNRIFNGKNMSVLALAIRIHNNQLIWTGLEAKQVEPTSRWRYKGTHGGTYSSKWKRKRRIRPNKLLRHKVMAATSGGPYEDEGRKQISKTKIVMDLMLTGLRKMVANHFIKRSS